jgi:4-hydroxythreonine-4-phosphate dehydrogenase
MKLGITMGDPRGIGPEIILRSLKESPALKEAQVLLYGDSQIFSHLPSGPDRVELVPVTRGPSGLSWTDEECGHASILYLEQAVRDAMEKKIDAMITAPICKAHLQKAGYDYPGHTEFLAERTGSPHFVMMMASPSLKVTLVTIHVPLKEVPYRLSEEKILDTVRITIDSLQNFWGLPRPRVAVCGLNPHAGEEGILGKEEITLIGPAIDKLRSQGYELDGPMVPDAVFHQAHEGKYDAVVCMYHDQGLIPFKMLHFRDGVNVTLGLPIIRTSPDHGVAFDIVGKGVADPASMLAAIDLAMKMAEVKKRGM